MQIELNSNGVIERTVDSRGRVRIGPEYCHEDVWIAIIEATDDGFNGTFEDEEMVDVTPDDVVDRTADSRGRVRIGAKFADRQVRVSVLRTADE